MLRFKSLQTEEDTNIQPELPNAVVEVANRKRINVDAEF